MSHASSAPKLRADSLTDFALHSAEALGAARGLLGHADLRSIIERVVVTAKENGLEVELFGEIARMVEMALSDGSKKSRPR